MHLSQGNVSLILSKFVALQITEYEVGINFKGDFSLGWPTDQDWPQTFQVLSQEALYLRKSLSLEQTRVTSHSIYYFKVANYQCPK
jgi:hypothetical protein